MPGIFGAYKTNKIEPLSDLMDKMLSYMVSNHEIRVDQFMDKGLCLGRASLGILNLLTQPIKDPSGNLLIIFHGELYNNPGTLSDPEYILNLYKQRGDECAAELNGIFHFVIYDKQSGQIKLFSDKFGLQPLYYAALADGIIFAPTIKAILREESINKEPDYQGLADFLHFGQILGQKTLFKNIKLLAPGSILTFNPTNNSVSFKKYWKLESLFVEKGYYNPKVSIEEVVELLIKSIKKQTMNKEKLGLSLSGGLDTRGILAGLGKDAEGLHTYTLGLKGCADEILSQKMARVAKTKHEFIELDQNYLNDFYSMAHNMSWLSDGMYHPHESTEMLAYEYFKRAPFKILLRGHGGEIAKAALAYPVMVTPQVYSFSTDKDILEYIFNITNLVIRDNEPSKFFTPSFYAKIKGGDRESLEESCDRVSEMLAPPDMCIYYYINEHIRRQVVASLDIFRTQIEIRMPYIDEEYIKLLLQLPVSQRNHGEIHFELIKRCMPALIKIPNSNTGAPLNAGPLRLFLTDKFNSLMKRLSIRGFRHYTEFQDWQRKNFRETTEKIIFSNRLQNRDIYDKKYLKVVFENHVSGKKNYAHLLGTMVGLELWFRNFVD